MQKQKKNKKTAAQRVSMYGICIALAMILSYIETLIPINFGIPGIKPGLANLAVFTALYLMTPVDAFLISMIRILLISITFGNLYALLYSMAGGILSFAVMLLCKKKRLFGKTGVSIMGGVFHNAGQLLVAAAVLENTAVFVYFPVLLISGMCTGALIGLAGAMVLRRLPEQVW